MPITFHIDVAHRIVFTLGFGTVTDKDLLQHNIDLKADPAFDPTFNQLLVFTEVINADVTSETIYWIINHRIFNLSSLRAIVVKPGLQYGFALMFQNMRSIEDNNIRVFLDLDEAKSWLGLSSDESGD
jgi:hypothetical protein